MRTPRIAILVLFLVACLFIFCRSISAAARHRPAITTTSTRPKPQVTSFFSFNNGFSLFSPNAAISLTDDNSTSFPAQPAAFGPNLPHKGLKGQLWVGSGFSDETLREGLGDGELGCSDIPGWPDTRPDGIVLVSGGGDDSTSTGHDKRDYYDDDGTDDYLHMSIRGRGKGPSDSASAHADIQTIQESAEINGKIVLLSRGGCGFLEKVLWAQRRGATALIVGDNQKGGPLTQMWARGDTSNVTIPSVFTARTTAHLLSSLTQPGSFIAETIDEHGRRALKVQQSRSRKDGTENSGTQSVDRAQSNEPRVWAEDEANEDQSNSLPRRRQLTWWQKLFGRGAGQAPEDKQLNLLAVEEGEDAKDKSSVVDLNDVDPDADISGADDVFQVGARDPHPRAPLRAERRDLGPEDSPPIAQRNSDDSDPLARRNFISNIFSEEASDDSMDEDPPSSKPPPPDGDEPHGHDGLWVTITPSNSGNPFFDTLLVLVISPLVTLTIVYAMLIVRARIRRRRWRAPKSVVEQLPVRTYHTVTASPLLTPRSPSPNSSSPTTPLLQHAQATQAQPPSRPRPRSRTTTGIPETESLLTVSAAIPTPRSANRPEHEKTPGSVSSEWKKYMGRQVECVVCLEEYVDGVSQVMSLPCGHEFHAECITPWLTTRRRTCPICKGDVVRSLARRGSTSSPRYEPYHDDTEDDDDAQGSGSSDQHDDLEQGILSPIPTRRDGRTDTWLGRLSSSFGATSRSSESLREGRDR